MYLARHSSEQVISGELIIMTAGLKMSHTLFPQPKQGTNADDINVALAIALLLHNGKRLLKIPSHNLAHLCNEIRSHRTVSI